MKLQRGGWPNNKRNIWIYLLFFAVLLVLVKFFFVGTYYVADEEVLPGHVSTNSLLIVSIQSLPRAEGDIILLESESGDLRPALFVSRSKGIYQVMLGDEIMEVNESVIRGKVISCIQL